MVKSLYYWVSHYSALTAVKNKIPDASSLVKKTDYDTKISEIGKKFIDHSHDKYITTPEFNNLVAWVFTARLASRFSNKDRF